MIYYEICMQSYEEDGKVILENVSNFNIKEILECGQCFRFEKIDELEYRIVAMGKVLNIKQEMNRVELYPCSMKEYEEIWYNYFDMDINYTAVKNIISKDDIIMKKAIEFAGGIRILNQDPYECLLSFIISQNNNIPRIKGIIANLSQKYGSQEQGEFLFPTLEQLKDITEEDLKELKVGFRAKYIKDCIDKLYSGEVSLKDIDSLSTSELLKRLLTIKGVGQKVADCSMLFSMKRREVFPTDVWVKRVMEQLYFNGEETNIKEIHKFAKEKWGDLAGYAQQYLFYYARSMKIGVK